MLLGLTIEYVKGDVLRAKLVMILDSRIRLKETSLSKKLDIASKIITIQNQRIINVLGNGDAEIYSKIESTKLNSNGALTSKSAEDSYPLILVKSKSGVTKSITKMMNNSLDRSTGELIYSNWKPDANGSDSYDRVFRVGESWAEDTVSPFGGYMHCVSKLIHKGLKYGGRNTMIIDVTQIGTVDGNLLYGLDVKQNEPGNTQPEVTGTFRMQGTDRIDMKDGKSISSCGLVNMRIEMTPQKLRESRLPPLLIVVDGTYEESVLPLKSKQSDADTGHCLLRRLDPEAT